MGKMITIGTDVDEMMLVKIDEFAATYGLDRAGVVQLALSEYIAEQKAIDDFVQVGLDSLANEPTLDQDEARAWLADRRRHRIAAE